MSDKIPPEEFLQTVKTEMVDVLRNNAVVSCRVLGRAKTSLFNCYLVLHEGKEMSICWRGGSGAWVPRTATRRTLWVGTNF